MGGKLTWVCILEENDKKKCDKCQKPFKVNDWIRIESIFDLKKNYTTWTGKIFCFECSEKYFKSGTLARIIEIKGEDSEKKEEDKNESE